MLCYTIMLCLRYTFFLWLRKVFGPKVCTCLEFLRHLVHSGLGIVQTKKKKRKTMGQVFVGSSSSSGCSLCYILWFLQCVTHVGSCSALQSCTILSTWIRVSWPKTTKCRIKFQRHFVDLPDQNVCLAVVSHTHTHIHTHIVYCIADCMLRLYSVLSCTNSS